jgi:hypothetical protein
MSVAHHLKASFQCWPTCSVPNETMSDWPDGVGHCEPVMPTPFRRVCVDDDAAHRCNSRSWASWAAGCYMHVTRYLSRSAVESSDREPLADRPRLRLIVPWAAQCRMSTPTPEARRTRKLGLRRHVSSPAQLSQLDDLRRPQEARAQPV